MYSQHFNNNRQKMHWISLLPSKLDKEINIRIPPSPHPKWSMWRRAKNSVKNVSRQLYYTTIYFSLKYKAYKIRYVHWFTDCSNMTVIWVNWTSFIRESSISWGSETLKDTPFLNLMFPDGKWNVSFFCLFCAPPSSAPPQIDCSCRANKGRLSAFTNQARFHTVVLFACCFTSPGQTLKSIFL